MHLQSASILLSSNRELVVQRVRGEMRDMCVWGGGAKE